MEHDLDRHHLMWAVGECCRNGLRRAPFFTHGGSQSSVACLQPDDLGQVWARLMPTAFAHWWAVYHRGFVRLPDEHLGLPAERTMFSMHNVRLPAAAGMMPIETIRRRLIFTVDMRAPSLRVPAPVRPSLSFSSTPSCFINCPLVTAKLLAVS